MWILYENGTLKRLRQLSSRPISFEKETNELPSNDLRSPLSLPIFLDRKYFTISFTEALGGEEKRESKSVSSSREKD